MTEIGLAEVIRALRSELDAAISEGEKEKIRFEATALDLEFNVGVKKSMDGKGGIKFWVLELGGGASHSTETIQKVRLSLLPVTGTGDRVRIAKGTEESPLSGRPSQR